MTLHTTLIRETDEQNATRSGRSASLNMNGSFKCFVALSLLSGTGCASEPETSPSPDNHIRVASLDVDLSTVDVCWVADDHDAVELATDASFEGLDDLVMTRAEHAPLGEDLHIVLVPSGTGCDDAAGPEIDVLRHDQDADSSAYRSLVLSQHDDGQIDASLVAEHDEDNREEWTFRSSCGASNVGATGVSRTTSISGNSCTTWTTMYECSSFSMGGDTYYVWGSVWSSGPVDCSLTTCGSGGHDE